MGGKKSVVGEIVLYAGYNFVGSTCGGQVSVDKCYVETKEMADHYREEYCGKISAKDYQQHVFIDMPYKWVTACHMYIRKYKASLY
jgi:Na+-transporting NADH:ubiquinone oxidoreductase subunit NqrF